MYQWKLCTSSINEAEICDTLKHQITHENLETHLYEQQVSKINEYYSWLLGEEAWLIVKQFIAFMLRAKEEYKELANNGFNIIKLHHYCELLFSETENITSIKLHHSLFCLFTVYNFGLRHHIVLSGYTWYTV